MSRYLSAEAADLIVARLRALLATGHDEAVALVALRLQQLYLDGFQAGVEAYYERLIDANARVTAELSQLGRARAAQNDASAGGTITMDPAPIASPGSRQSER